MGGMTLTMGTSGCLRKYSETKVTNGRENCAFVGRRTGQQLEFSPGIVTAGGNSTIHLSNQRYFEEHQPSVSKTFRSLIECESARYTSFCTKLVCSSPKNSVIVHAK